MDTWIAGETWCLLLLVGNGFGLHCFWIWNSLTHCDISYNCCCCCFLVFAHLVDLVHTCHFVHLTSLAHLGSLLHIGGLKKGRWKDCQVVKIVLAQVGHSSVLFCSNVKKMKMWSVKSVNLILIITLLFTVLFPFMMQVWFLWLSVKQCK